MIGGHHLLRDQLSSSSPLACWPALAHPWALCATAILPPQTVGSAEDALAMALAKLTGHVEMRPRSLLTAHEDFTTLQFVSPYTVEKPGQVRGGWVARG